MTRSNWQADQELVTTGASGVWWAMYTMPATYEATDENMVVQAMPSPKLNEDAKALENISHGGTGTGDVDLICLSANGRSFNGI